MAKSPLAAKGADFLFLGHQDYSGLLRGRSVPRAGAAGALKNGLPWVPANYTICPLNTLPADNPFGPMGEIRLMPDAAARLSFAASGGNPSFDLRLCSAVTVDASPWPWCPRTALKTAVAALQAKTGLTLKVAFEHEFLVRGLARQSHVAFSLSAGRRVAPLAQQVMGILDNAGIALEQFQAEYGLDQFEVASAPLDPLAAADAAILTLEAIRECARQAGLHASFLPKPAPDQAGNGVHIHLSLWKGSTPVTAARDWLTEPAAAFAAGLIGSAEALIACTTGSANSYQRIRTHSWVGVHTCIGVRNREAMIRLVPRGASRGGGNPGASIEFRVADATANVYLALAAIIRAGLAGIEAGLPAPPGVSQDPDTLTPEERAALGIRLLPQSLGAALTPEAASRISAWFGPPLAAAYLSCRRNDLKNESEMSPESLTARLVQVY